MNFYEIRKINKSIRAKYGAKRVRFKRTLEKSED